MNHEQFRMLNTTAVYLALFTLPIFSKETNAVWLVFCRNKKCIGIVLAPHFFQTYTTAISTTLTLRPTCLECITCTLITLKCVAV